MVLTRRLTRSSLAWLRLSSSFLDVLGIYAQRDQTRREYLQEILERLGLKQFDRITHREIARWLLPTALQTTQGSSSPKLPLSSFEGVCIVLPLVGLGIPEYEAKAYEERIKKGGYLVAVHVDDSKKGDAARDIMKKNGLQDISSVSEK